MRKHLVNSKPGRRAPDRGADWRRPNGHGLRDPAADCRWSKASQVVRCCEPNVKSGWPSNARLFIEACVDEVTNFVRRRHASAATPSAAPEKAELTECFKGAFAGEGTNGTAGNPCAARDGDVTTFSRVCSRCRRIEGRRFSSRCCYRYERGTHRRLSTYDEPRRRCLLADL